MITPAYAATATERVLPRLALDFTTGVLDPRVNMTRSLNTATRINASGFIETVNADLPRFDYNPATLAPRGLLIEETRRNYLLNTDNFANAYWTKNNTSIVLENVTAPDNSPTCEKLVESATTSAKELVRLSTTMTLGAIGDLSGYFKFGGRRYLSVYSQGPGGANTAYGVFDLQNGVVSASGGAQILGVGIRPAANGFYRCFVIFNITSSTVHSSFYLGNSAVNPAPSYAGDGVSGVYVRAVQLEQGFGVTSYIPNTSTSQTRNADVAAMLGASFSGWWQPSVGAMLARARQSVITGTRPWAYISDGTANNIISLRGNAANPELFIKATTDQAQIDAGTLASDTSYGMVGAWSTDNCAAAINGGAAVTDASATIPTVDRMLIGSDGTNYLNGWVEKIAFWPQRVTNAEAQAFSK